MTTLSYEALRDRAVELEQQVSRLLDKLQQAQEERDDWKAACALYRRTNEVQIDDIACRTAERDAAIERGTWLWHHLDEAMISAFGGIVNAGWTMQQRAEAAEVALWRRSHGGATVGKCREHDPPCQWPPAEAQARQEGDR